jgi:aryl-alcohol dehydrogenase-like predicted oxidoreductase
MFGIRDYNHNPSDPWKDNFKKILQVLEEVIKEGKVRHVGLSNEKAWGTMRYLEESKQHDLPRMITIQNAYSLLNRIFEGDTAEVAMRENIKLLAYSPLAFGVLSGKYIKGTAADNARLKLFPRFARYSSEQSTEAAKAYLKLAEENNLSLAKMSLAFVTQQPFVLSNIIGATSLEQLEENIDSINVGLDKDLLAKINDIHARIPNPAP